MIIFEEAENMEDVVKESKKRWNTEEIGEKQKLPSGVEYTKVMAYLHYYLYWP